MQVDIVSELSGSLGDLGTLLPILVSLVATGQTNLSASLVVGGIFNIVGGLYFKIPICVQPMKAIAAVALSSHLSSTQIGSAGFCVSAIVFGLSISNLLTPIYRLCPLPLIRGIQLGTGLAFVNKGVAMVLSSGNFNGGVGTGLDTFKFFADNYLISVFALILVFAMYPKKRLNFSALILFGYCLVCSFIEVYHYKAHGGGSNAGIGPGFPPSFMWSNITSSDFRTGFLSAGLGQLPLTLLNSVFATAKLADDLFPDRSRPVASVQAIGIFVGLMNLIGVWFGSLPYCAGSGGLAGQYRFGARTQYSVIFLGVCKIFVGLLFGKLLLPIIQSLPGSVLGVMLAISGIELASAVRDLTVTDRSKLKENPYAFLVALVGGSVVAASGNDGIGFVAATVTAFVLWVHSVRDEEGCIESSNRDSLMTVVCRRIVAHVKCCFNEPEESLGARESVPTSDPHLILAN